MKPSMGSVGDAYDNAMCESFFATLERELLDRRRFKTHAEAEMAISDFIASTTPTAFTRHSTTSPPYTTRKSVRPHGA